MALIKCPECSGQVSDKALLCPHCGFPMREGSYFVPGPPEKPGNAALTDPERW